VSKRRPIRDLLLAGTSVLALAWVTAPAAAQGDGAERVYRREALAHAEAIATAWRRLETHILKGSAGPAGWDGPVPPPETGWLSSWTERGLRARYCEDILLVYMGPDSLKGVGADHRSVHVAPHLYIGAGSRRCTGWRTARPGAAPTARRSRAGSPIPICNEANVSPTSAARRPAPPAITATGGRLPARSARNTTAAAHPSAIRSMAPGGCSPTTAARTTRSGSTTPSNARGTPARPTTAA